MIRTIIALLAAGSLLLPAAMADAGGRRSKKAPTSAKASSAKAAGSEVDGPSTRKMTKSKKVKKSKKTRKAKKTRKSKKGKAAWGTYPTPKGTGN